MTIERKAEKRSLYFDMRDDGDTEDTMENWDEAKLQEVIEKKHGKDKRMPTTDIVSRKTDSFKVLFSHLEILKEACSIHTLFRNKYVLFICLD